MSNESVTKEDLENMWWKFDEIQRNLEFKLNDIYHQIQVVGSEVQSIKNEIYGIRSDCSTIKGNTYPR